MAKSINLKGTPFFLVGPEIQVGAEAPQAVLVTQDLQEKVIGGAKGKIQLLITVPSLDTPVCERETQKFNELLAKLENVEVTVISMDLPFAQKRFCESYNIKNVSVVSDFRYKDMEKFGVLIGEGPLKGLLARSIFIINKEGKVEYIQIVPEITEEPNYSEVIEMLKKLL